MTVQDLCDTCGNEGNGRIALYSNVDGHQAYVGEYKEIKEKVTNLLKYKVVGWKFDSAPGSKIDFVLNMRIEAPEYKDWISSKLKCKDCKYFKRDKNPAARSGHCTGNENYHDAWIGCGTQACKKFESK